MTKAVKTKKYLLYIVLLAVGVGIGFVLDQDKQTQAVTPVSVREVNSGYKFINPLLFVQVEGDQEDSEYMPLHDSIANYIDRAQAEQRIADASVYVRKLNKGKWISVNPEKTYSPSSMLKVVNLITVLRAVESDPSLLHKQLNIKGDDSAYLQEGGPYAPRDPVRVGGQYTVQELIEHSMIQSDNVANKALKTMIGDQRISKTYEDLRMPEVEKVADRGYSPEDYSHLFRALYNGSYLSRPISEQVLGLLSKTEFNQGLVAGVPEGTVVSHKFGVNTIDNYSELHDCGIVYYPDHPYFICVMTRGYDLAVLETVLQDISQTAWNYVNTIAKEEN